MRDKNFEIAKFLFIFVFLKKQWDLQDSNL